MSLLEQLEKEGTKVKEEDFIIRDIKAQNTPYDPTPPKDNKP